MDTILFILIIITGFYTAWNIGANDVANAMGTSVGSGALTLKRAVFVAAILEFCGAFFFGSHVSQTIQSGIIKTDIFIADPRILVYGMLSALAASGIWLQIASYYGWPVSTTHSIIGAVVGFGAIVGGLHAVYWENVIFIAVSWIISPLLGGVLAYYLFTLVRKHIFYTLDPLEATRRLTPVLVFLVLLVLSILLIYEALAHISFFQHHSQRLTLCFSIAFLGAFISYMIIKKSHLNSGYSLQAKKEYDVLISLDKAIKHLARVRSQSSGAELAQANAILADVEALNQQLLRKEEQEIIDKKYADVEKIFGCLQVVSACMMAFAHGANDVANAIGPLSAAIETLKTGLFSVNNPVPTWALALGGAGIVTGLATWGWRVIETIGKKITELTPSRGFCAEFGAATTIMLASRLGMPISTTHTLVGAVLGVGFARGLGAVNLTTTRDIVISWVVTIPIGALLAIILFYPIHQIFG